MPTHETRRPRTGRETARHEATKRDDTSAAEWLTVEEFCDELSVPLSTAYKWSSHGPASGRFPRFCRLPNGKIRMRREWVEEWLEGLADA